MFGFNKFELKRELVNWKTAKKKIKQRMENIEKCLKDIKDTVKTLYTIIGVSKGK